MLTSCRSRRSELASSFSPAVVPAPLPLHDSRSRRAAMRAAVVVPGRRRGSSVRVSVRVCVRVYVGGCLCGGEWRCLEGVVGGRGGRAEGSQDSRIMEIPHACF